MRRYLLSFFVAYLLAAVVTFVVLLVGLINWFFDPVPVWFDVFCALAVLLVFLGVGILGGKKAREREAPTPRRGMLLCVAVLAIWGFLESLGVEAIFSLVGMSGITVGNGVISAFDLTYRWGYQTYQTVVWPIVGTLCAAAQGVFFHLGWKIGRKE